MLVRSRVDVKCKMMAYVERKEDKSAGREVIKHCEWSAPSVAPCGSATAAQRGTCRASRSWACARVRGWWTSGRCRPRPRRSTSATCARSKRAAAAHGAAWACGPLLRERKTSPGAAARGGRRERGRRWMSGRRRAQRSGRRSRSGSKRRIERAEGSSDAHAREGSPIQEAVSGGVGGARNAGQGEHRSAAKKPATRAERRGSAACTVAAVDQRRARAAWP